MEYYSRPKRNRKQKIVLAIAIISVIFNIVAILPYIKPYYTMLENKYFPPKHFAQDSPDKDVIKAVCEATLRHSGTKMSMSEPKGLPLDVIAFFKPQRNSDSPYNYYTAYGYVGLSYYAIQAKDSAMMDELKEKATQMYSPETKSLSYNFIKIDQAPIGIFFLNLYKWYHTNDYKQVAQSIFRKIEAWKNANGIIMYRHDTDLQLSDAVGMYVPFLMEYFNATGDSTAYKTATCNMRAFYAYGVNHETGIPAHGYNTKNGLPVGSANWGRGIGWYLLAAAYCPQFNDPALAKTLRTFDYTQFPGSSEKFDSSTALMTEIYKQSKDPARKLSLKFIKPHIHANGFVADCSGDTYGLNSYSKMFSESELCNGLLLILVSKFNSNRPLDRI